MSDADDLQRDLDLIRHIADRGVMDIEAAGREAQAAIRREMNAAQEPQAQEKPVVAAPPSDLEEDDFYQFRRFQQ